MRTLLLGSTGLLGCTLQPMLAEMGYEVITHGFSGNAEYQADLTDAVLTGELLENVRPDVLINLVGLTDVDRCETSPNEAYLANVRVIENVVNWIKQQVDFPHLIQISTDQVYDGVGEHTEDQVSLMNCYAFSKYAGELVASNVPSSILRTNFIGRSHCDKRESLTDWLYRSLVNGDGIQVFEDVKFSPLSMKNIAVILDKIMQVQPIGVFNLGSHNGMSKADFAFLFADMTGVSSSSMTRTTTDQVSFINTYRPKDMRMDCSRLEEALGVNLPDLKSEIEHVAREYYEET